MHRRNFLRYSLGSSAALLGAGMLSDHLFGQNPKEFIDNGGEGPHGHLTCYPDTGNNGNHQLQQLWVRKNNVVLTSYRAHPSQKYPFFYPVMGPVSGLSLTSESGSPWPHHRSVFFGLDQVNGGNYWQDNMSRGQIVSQGPSFAKKDGKYDIGADFVNIVDRCLWRQPGKDPIIEDNRKFAIKMLEGNRYVLDADIVVKALTKITVKRTNHGLFGVRCAPDLAPTGGGNILSSEGGKTQKETEGKPARWMAFYGKRAGLKEEIVEGISVFCPSKAPHPKFENCPWFTRDYGNCSPMPFNYFKQKDETFELVEGEELKLRYRVVAFAGTPKDANLDGLWNEFDKKGGE